MNSLNLRVSTVRTGENAKKNADMRAALVPLPKHYLTAEESYCRQFGIAQTVPEQVSVVKNIFKNLGNDAVALQFLADLYFYSALKHPVRNQIQKLLITAARLGTGGVDDSVIATALAHTLQRLVCDTKTEMESSAWNIGITSLNGCFENFDCGLQAMRQSTDVVFPFLCAAVQRYLTELGVLSSPSVRNEYYLYIHNAIRLILSCVQEFASALRQQHAEQLKQLNVICREIIMDSEIPMDPRTNSGILMAQSAKLFNDYDTFVQQVKLTKNANEIALCVGIINTFDQHDFQQMSTDIRDICGKIDEIANANATIPNILLCATRALYQISKILLAFELKPAPSTAAQHVSSSSQHVITDDAKLILRKLLIFTFGYLEHHMDSVRHLCRDLLRNVVAAAHKIQFDFLLRKIYDACNSDRISLSMKCIVLQQTAAILGADEVTRNCPTLFTDLFAMHLGRDFMVNNLYEVLMCVSHKEIDFEKWRLRWCDYLLDIACLADKRLSDVETLVVKAVKCDHRLVQHIIKEPRLLEGGDEKTPQVPISTKLSALWAVRKSGIRIDNFNEIMQRFSKHITYSILSNCDETRIMALRLLVETHKTTEMCTPIECQHLLTYLEYNANSQSPATRQKSVSLLSKALMRYELNLMKVLKQHQQPTTSANASKDSTLSASGSKSPMPSPSPSSSSKSVTELPQMKFLLDVMHILVANLFAGANFSRRSVSLTLLEQCVRICINCKLNVQQVLPANTVPALVEQINDSYEANKELAVKILKLLEDEMDYSLIKTHNLQINLPRIHELLTSVRPLDSVTGAYYLEFFCNRADVTAFGEFLALTYNPTYFAALRWLLLELRTGLKRAKQSILKAAKLNPLYGILFAVKHMLQHMDFVTISQDLPWRILIAELIVVCKELTNVVAPVVNSSSPEGHLPNDFGEMPMEFTAAGDSSETEATEALEENVNGDCRILAAANANKLNLATMRTTPQMVLLCAWRTVKEVSLILGEIVLRSPIQVSKLTEQFLVTKEQILEIGEHFKQLLAETKHRGAFEQAYVGFCKLCCRLWRVEVHDLNCMPMQWLRELITLISRDDQINEKICATRRSAGVPFMAQALITAELQLGSSKSLYYCMSHLLQLCATPDRSIEARTHAMNILRALFRCTDLSEAVGEFVCEGVICALRGYDASTWAERNAATLLFAALITRIFGVQRTRGHADTLNIRNKMTGRIFFLRYPKLYDYFLEQLRQASILVCRQQKAFKLHPLLLLLSRLYPSALEGTESNLKLSEFIPYISICAGCCEMQTRYLAAKAIVALISVDALVITILRRCSDIVILADKPHEMTLNVIHGHLLQIYWLLKALISASLTTKTTTLSAELVSDLCCTLVTFHEKTEVRNAVVLKVILDIFIELLQSLSSLTYTQETIHHLLYFSTRKELRMPPDNYYYPVLRKSYYIYNLHTLRLTLPFGALSDFLLNPPLTHASIKLEQVETCLNVILLVLLHGATAVLTADEFNEFEFAPMELQFVQALDERTCHELANELRCSKPLQLSLKELLQKSIFYPECAAKAYAILSLLDHFDFTLAQLIKDSAKHIGDVKTQLCRCVERIVHKHGIDYKNSQLCLEYLLEIAQPWQSENLRFKSSKILAQIAIHYPKAIEKKKLTFLRAYIGIMLSLLMDDDYAVRDHTAKIVLEHLPDDIGMENVVSTMAQRLFLQHTADMLLQMKADDNYVLEVFKLIGELLNANANADEQQSSSGESSSTPTLAGDMEIFDKNEANVFAEPLKAIHDCIVVFTNTFRERTKIIRYIDEFKLSC